MKNEIKWYPSIKRIDNNEINRNAFFQDKHFWEQEFEIQEKMDGSNISVIKHNDELLVFSRNQKVNLKDFKGLEDLIKQIKPELMKKMKNDEILNFEFLEQGGIKYTKEKNELPIVIFDYGMINPIYLKSFLEEPITVEEKAVLEGNTPPAKIKFYDLETTKQKFNNFKYPSILKCRVKMIKGKNEKFCEVVEDLKIKINNQEFSLKSDEFETFLLNEVFRNSSKLFPKTNEVEGIVIKSNDGKFRIKKVFKEYQKNHVKKSQNKSKKTDDVLFLKWVDEQVAERYEKFANYLFWKEDGQNIFKGIKNIYQYLFDNKKELGKIINEINWIVDDIINECPLDVLHFNKEYILRENDQVNETTKEEITKRVIRKITNYIVSKEWEQNTLKKKIKIKR